MNGSDCPRCPVCGFWLVYSEDWHDLPPVTYCHATVGGVGIVQAINYRPGDTAEEVANIILLGMGLPVVFDGPRDRVEASRHGVLARLQAGEKVTFR